MSFQVWYVNFLVKHPLVIIVTIAVVSCTCIILPFTVKSMHLPNFEDPQMGFSTRSTKISNRLTAWNNLQNEIRPSGLLTKNPKEYLTIKKFSLSTFPPNVPHFKKKGSKSKHKKQKLSNDLDVHDTYKNQTIYGKVITNERNSTDKPEFTNKWQAIQNISEHNPKVQYEDHFCGSPSEKYVHLVLVSPKQGDLFTLENLQHICRLENMLMNLDKVGELCISNVNDKCCKPWTLPNYIAALFKRHSCLSITKSDVNKTKEILTECSSYFQSNELYLNCFKKQDCKIPLRCLKHDIVYNIFHFIAGTSFFPSEMTEQVWDSTKQKLEETMMFLPISVGVGSEYFYYEVEKLRSEFKELDIVAMDFGIKSVIFDRYLIRDSWLMGLGGSFLLICVWIYTSSFFLTVMTITSIIFAMAIAYFLYEVVYDIYFFPFMNMLTLIICLGIGADNAFIFCKIWKVKCNDQSNDNDIVKIMSGTFNHAFKSMFVTTLTTAVAFWGSYVSNVTAISCFSIFAGTAIIVNFILTMTWFPASLVIWQRSCLSNPVYPCHFITFRQTFCCLRSRWTMSFYKYLTLIWNEKKEFIIKLVVKLRYLWIVCFTSIAVVSIVVVFVTPGLQLPTTVEFQLFKSEHPFEKYDFHYRNKFWFAKEKEGESGEYVMPLRFVWGVKQVDNGDHLNPANLGTLELDPGFDMVDPASQVWLRDFCSNLKLQSFFGTMYSVPSLTRCFIETYQQSMARRCIDDFSKKDISPCCESSLFPFNRTVFNKCIFDEMEEIYNGPVRFIYPKTAGAMFSKEDVPKIKAVVIEYDSNITFSMSFEEIDSFYNEVAEWTERQLSTAPASMKNGFFISDLAFYDLQRELSEGTNIAILVSMVLASGILIMSTLNPLLSILAVVTITFSIITTIASLVLCGWTLNILESVAISTAIGLAVDFSLHYCISYRLCPADLRKSKEEATRYALSSIMGPSFMAGLTSAAAGFFMIFSLILPYFQIGLFLMLIMAVSWLYATFFLGALLATMGPTNNCCQYSYTGLISALLRKDKNTSRENKEPRASTCSTTELDRVSFIKQDTPIPVKKKSVKNPSVRYTSKQAHSDLSPSSNVTIIMADVISDATADDNDS